MIEEWYETFLAISFPSQISKLNSQTIDYRLSRDMPALMGSGKLKSNPLLHREGGLEGLNEGMNYQKAGKVRLLLSLDLSIPFSID